MSGGAAALTVYYVEDDAAVRRGGEQALVLAGLSVRSFGAAEAALAAIGADVAGIVVSDVRLPGMDGLALLRAVLARDAEIPVILVTGHGDVTMAVEAMRAGAYDFIEKPFGAERLVDLARRALARRALVLENRRLRRELSRHAAGAGILGVSEAAQRLRTLVASLGPAGVDVLLYGETGAGKEVIARALHDASGRRGEFVAVNCGAIPESVFESEIFGFEAGAFTGAVRRRIGRIEYAQGGTVFLDEIESMPPALQVKLLRVLQERRVERLGGNESQAIDCRFIAASKADLLALANDAGGARFRLDLYYRLSVATIDIPPLRERTEDIPLLADRFIHEAAIRYERPVPDIDAAQLEAWLAYRWPGNVRELRNAAERMVLGLAAMVEPAVPADAGAADRSLTARMDAFERALLVTELKRTGGNVGVLAESLNVPRKTLYDRLRRHDLVPGHFRPARED